MNNLNNIANYNNSLDIQSHIIFLKYVGVVHELIQCVVDNIYIQNNDYLRYIIILGIKNIGYIFKLLILYTKNVELTIFHCQKSILYYVEFIGQIGENNQNFLNLNSKDAVLFLFKKTIFMINNDFRTKFTQDTTCKNILDTSNKYITIYNNILFQFINTYNFKDENTKIQNIIFTKIYKIVESLIQYEITYKKDKDTHNKNEKLDSINNVVTMINLNYNQYTIRANYTYLIDFFVKKMQKKHLDLNIIKQNLTAIDNQKQFSSYSVCKIYNFLVTP